MKLLIRSPLFLKKLPPTPTNIPFSIQQQGGVAVAVGNLRASAFAKAKKLGQTRRGDTLQLLGKSADWYHIRTSENTSAFIYERLVREMGN